MDYPFNLKGILYFPRINSEYDSIEGTIKLYNNQVFVADNIKEVIPEYLMLLKGCIDCPDMPLNVSRSALQNDGFVKKISDYITKKVADKLSGMYKTDRESYEKYWDDISPFIKYGIIRDDNFSKRMSEYVIYKNLEGKYLTLPEYLEASKDTHANKVFYITNEKQQSQYINMFKEQKIDAVYLTHLIDMSFIPKLEADNKDVKFFRIDSDLDDVFKEETSEDDKKKLDEDKDKLTEIWKKALGAEEMDVKLEKLKDASKPAMITVSEDMRRMQDYLKAYGMNDFGGSAADVTLVLNANNDLVKYVLEHPEGENTEMICQQIYDLAYLSYAQLPADEMTKFVERSNKIMELLAK
jgi:molecular chaperone HtpG